MSNNSSQPRVQPIHALRTRLALAYTILTLFLTGILSLGSYFGLSFALERRLREETTRYGRDLQGRFDDPINALKQKTVFYGDVYYQFHNLEGKPVAEFHSSNLGNLQLPTVIGVTYLENRLVWVERTSWTLRSRVIGSIYVAVDARELEQTRKFALIALAGLASLATILAFPLGYTIGARGLKPLEVAAARAASVDPSNPQALGLTGLVNDEVGILVNALEGTLTRIRDRQEVERGTLAEIAHELGTPLTVLTAQLEKLSAQTANPLAISARDAAWDIARTSEDLLLLARGELEPTLDLHLLDVRDVLKAVALEYQQSPLELVLPSTRLEISADPLRLRQAIRNLTRNAVRAVTNTKETREFRPATVQLKLEQQGQKAVISVVDNGPGIRPEDLEHIFERFYSRAGGSGIGLAVVRRIARAHGGEARALNNATGGATFVLELPLADLEAE
jgi:two-component system, OmpR family, sensor kinase